MSEERHATKRRKTGGLSGKRAEEETGWEELQLADESVQAPGAQGLREARRVPPAWRSYAMHEPLQPASCTCERTRVERPRRTARMRCRGGGGGGL